MVGAWGYIQGMESWRAVPGLIGYEVSDQGRVRSARSSKILRTPLMGRGYPCVEVMLNPPGESKRGQVRCVHELVLTTFRGPRPEGMEARHLNGIKADNRLENLMWGTPLENAADRAAHGTDPRGEQNGMHKLTAQQVAVIRDLGDSIPASRVAVLAGVCERTVLAVRRGESWVTPEPASRSPSAAATSSPGAP